MNSGASGQSAAFFREAGTLPANAPSYVKRQADHKILQAIRAGRFCNILSARQTGKSSLMVRTSEALRTDGWNTLILDLGSLDADPKTVKPELWFLMLVRSLNEKLLHPIDLDSWRSATQNLGNAQRFKDFLMSAQKAAQQDIAIFIDEIDTTLRLPFTDDFFIAIKAFYNEQSSGLNEHRVVFVLAGVAQPTDLVKNPAHSYNIGESIELSDFSREEALHLLPGMAGTFGEEAQYILDRILFWSGGHPHLTQRLCALMVETDPSDSNTMDRVDLIVKKHFLISRGPHREINLKTVQDWVLGQKDSRSILKMYRAILQRTDNLDDRSSPSKNKLKLVGLVKPDAQTYLHSRNRIYEQAFSLDWIRRNMPPLISRRTSLWILGAAIFFMMILLPLVYLWQSRVAGDVSRQTYEQQFLSSSSALVRIAALHGLVNMDAAPFAADLFFNLSPAEQESLWMEIPDPLAVGTEITHLLPVLCRDPRFALQQGVDRLLPLMQAAIQPVAQSDVEGAELLAKELDFWNRAHAEQKVGNVEAALPHYDRTLEWDPKNPNLLLERGQARAGIGDFEGAMLDLEQAYRTAPPLEGRILDFIHGNPALYTFLGMNRERFSLALLFPPLTPVPSLTPTAVSQPADIVAINRDTMQSLELRSILGAGVINQALFSQDGRYLVLALSRRLMILDAETYETIRTIPTDFGNLRLAFSPDGRTLASSSEDRNIHLWDFPAGTLRQTLSGHTWTVYEIAFSPDGKYLASASVDNTVRLWSLPDGKWIKSFTHNTDVFSVAFSPNGRYLASGSRDKVVRVWSMDNFQSVAQLIVGDDVESVAFSQGEGLYLAAGCHDQKVYMWDTLTWTRIMIGESHTAWVMSVAFSPDGKTLASTGDDHSILFWDVENRTLLKKIPNAHTDRALSLSFSPDGKRLASAAWDGAVQIWDPVTLYKQEELRHGTGGVRSLAFLPGSHQLVSISGDQSIRLWDAEAGSVLKQWQFPESIDSLAVSPDGLWLITGGGDGRIRVIDRESGRIVREFGENEHFVGALAVLPDGERVAAGCGDGIVRIWDFKTSELIQKLEGQTAAVLSVAVSPDGAMLATASHRNLDFWDLYGGYRIDSFPLPDWSPSLSYSGDGFFLAAAISSRTEKTAYIFAAPGTEKTFLTGEVKHVDSVGSVLFMPGSNLLLSSSWRSLVLTDADVPSRTIQYWSNTDWVVALAASDDSRLVAAGSTDGTIWIWAVPSGTGMTIPQIPYGTALPFLRP